MNDVYNDSQDMVADGDVDCKPEDGRSRMLVCLQTHGKMVTPYEHYVRQSLTSITVAQSDVSSLSFHFTESTQGFTRERNHLLNGSSIQSPSCILYRLRQRYEGVPTRLEDGTHLVSSKVS